MRAYGFARSVGISQLLYFVTTVTTL